MTRSNPHDGRRLRAVGGPVPEVPAGRDVPARVPGSAHLDQVDLVFEGIGTAATAELNGDVLGHARGCSAAPTRR